MANNPTVLYNNLMICEGTIVMAIDLFYIMIDDISIGKPNK